MQIFIHNSGMKRIIFAILLLFSQSVYAKTEVGFTPSKECEDAVVYNIEHAKKSVDAAIYSINNKRIVAALKKAHRRGIKLRILTDKLQASAKSSKTLDLHREGVNIRVNSRHKLPPLCNSCRSRVKSFDYILLNSR